MFMVITDTNTNENLIGTFCIVNEDVKYEVLKNQLDLIGTFCIVNFSTSFK